MKYRDSGIGKAEAVVKAKQAAYLVANGWTKTSDTPGNFWMWKKEDKFGSTFYVDTKMAIHIQIAMEG